MKKLFFLLLVFIGLTLNVEAQFANVAFNSSGVDTVTNATQNYTPNIQIPYYSGIVEFYSNVTNIVDSINTVNMQGSMDNSNWINTGSTGYIASPSTLASFVVYETPPKFLYYRLNVVVNSGDSVSLGNTRFVYKLPKFQ